MHRVLLLLSSVLLVVPTSASAQSRMCSIEYIFGATNVNAITGHGGVSLAVSEDGDVSVLTWPSPSYSDQIAYVSSNALDARTMPRLGAEEGMGVFNGLVVEQAGVRSLSWLRDRSAWTTSQSYGPDDGANIHTVHRSGTLGLTVTVIDAVHPTEAVWVRRVRVERDAASPVEAAWLMTFANLSPVPPSSRIPELPVVDWAYDGRNDFAAVWDPDAQAIVHFHPGDQRIFDEPTDLLGEMVVDFGPVGEALASGAVDDAALRGILDGFDAAYAPGATMQLTTTPAPDQMQIGYDATPLCDAVDAIADNVLALPDRWPDFELPLDPAVLDALRCVDGTPVAEAMGWTHVAEDALADAADGELSGSPIAGDEVNEALRTPLTFDAGVAEASVVLSAGATLADARSAAAAVDPVAVPDQAEAALASWEAGVNLPGSAPTRVFEVARRSLINLRVGTDRETGAIVAAISRQPPYGLDWPRDGAFFNVALDVSGQSELVRRRAALYGEWQRDEPVRPTLLVDPDPPPPPGGGRARDYPADAWEMNYYADGEVGGLFRFEIDNTAFVLWSMVAHAGWEDDPEAYLRERWDNITRAAELLVYWRDEETGLHWPAQEDDHAAYTQTLNGAAPVFGGLLAATRAARLLGEEEAAIRWGRRAREMRDAILTHLWDEEAQRFVRDVGGTASPDRGGPTGTTGWLVWPAQLLPFDDARIRSQLLSDLSFIEPQIRLETQGGQYFMKNTVTFALTLGREPEYADRLAGLLELIADSHATETAHFGECMLTVDDGGTPTASQRVANPHLWEGTLFYLTAMATDDPDALLVYDTVLPDARLDEIPPEMEEPPAESGGCAAAPGAGTGAGALSMLAALALVLRRRRR